MSARATENMPCPTCGQPVDVWDGFCEACGKELAPPVVSDGQPGYVPQCPVCAADPDAPPAAITADGYCESCGRKVPTSRDHVELDLGPLAGVSDRGQRHARNEDAMALAASGTPDGQVAVAVVCDGVSTSPRPDEASLAAAQEAVRVLLAAARFGDDLAEASVAAVRAAADKLVGVAGPDGAPACTYASAVVERGGVTLCSLGDSRVYWVADAGSTCLTRDDSLAAELVAGGVLAEKDAMASPQAHVITQWLGADFPDPQPRVSRFTPPGPGVVLVCSDGLWNYVPEAADLALLALPTALTTPLDAAAALVTVANDAGGRDNITVILVPFPLRTP